MENKFKNETIDINLFHIKDSKYNNACFYQSISNSIFNKNIIFNNNLHKLIQKLSYEWIISNKNKYIEEFGLKVNELVNMCHEIDIDTYEKTYKYYADEFIEDIDNRWGSLIEAIAISEIFKISIFIYNSQKYDINRKKIIIGKIINNKPHKGVRLKLYQQIGLKYFNNDPICLLWKDGKYGPHYMSLKLNNDYILDINGFPLKI